MGLRSGADRPSDLLVVWGKGIIIETPQLGAWHAPADLYVDPRVDEPRRLVSSSLVWRSLRALVEKYLTATKATMEPMKTTTMAPERDVID